MDRDGGRGVFFRSGQGGGGSFKFIWRRGVGEKELITEVSGGGRDVGVILLFIGPGSFLFRIFIDGGRVVGVRMQRVESPADHGVVGSEWRAGGKRFFCEWCGGDLVRLLF